jgi:hypothetical protein
MTTATVHEITVSRRKAFAIAIAVLAAMVLAISLPLALRSTHNVVVVPRTASSVSGSSDNAAAPGCASSRDATAGSAAAFRLAEASSGAATAGSAAAFRLAEASSGAATAGSAAAFRLAESLAAAGRSC